MASTEVSIRFKLGSFDFEVTEFFCGTSMFSWYRWKVYSLCMIPMQESLHCDVFFWAAFFSFILWENYPGKRLNGLFLDDFEVSF